uniref:Uncharacterized protein n=1 Tax=Ulva intestinalis TaxID=3116 RepID=A0A8K1HSY0_ULVIN|nr:hypothetical protein LK039_mgp31 [Ulva intestinalis]UBR43430.1 hypothetical protein [Ulva intestinalis]
MTKKILKRSTQRKKEQVSSIVQKLLAENASLNADVFHMRIKMLEHNQIKTLDYAKEAIRACDLAIKNALVSAKLNSKQKAEILLIAKIEAFKIIASYVESINNNT